MRDFRDAKAMAHALRDALKSRAIETTHSESLELIANAFGYDNWNILAAKIEAAEPRAGAMPALSPVGVVDSASSQETLYCSFCGKSEHHVKKLIAGPLVLICDECAELCADIVRDEDPPPLWKVLRLLAKGGNDAYAAAAAHVRGRSTEDLAAYMEGCRQWAQRCRVVAQLIRRRLAMGADEKLAEDDLLRSPDFNYLNNRSKQELIALEQDAQSTVKRCDDALRIGRTILAEREPQRGA